MIEQVGWAAVAAMGVLALTQALGYSGWAPISVLQSLTPHLLLPAAPIAIAAAVTGRLAMAGTSAATVVALVVLVAPVIRHDRRPPLPDDAAEFTVAHANLLYSNEHAADDAIATLLATEADVLVFNEFTKAHRAQLVAGGAVHTYPHRVERAEYGPHGIGVWSRHPLDNTAFLPSTTRLGLVTTICLDGARVRLLAVHPPPPIRQRDMRGWIDGHSKIEEIAAGSDLPTLIVGDFNAARWHPPFRRLLERGWRDAHESLGQGFGASWPTDRLFPPAFVRLDHVLLGDGVVPVSVDDLDIAGSDHRGVVVRCSLAGRSAAR